jgi:hypothetical protein
MKYSVIFYGFLYFEVFQILHLRNCFRENRLWECDLKYLLDYVDISINLPH